MHIILAGVHFNQCAISLPELAHQGPAHSQPVGLIQDNPMKYAKATKSCTVGFLIVELQIASLNGPDYNCSTCFTIISGSMGCPPPGRCSIMEMWSLLREPSHHSLPFFHHQFRAISTLASSHYSGMYYSTIELM
jgi:hypothetical protein